MSSPRLNKYRAAIEVLQQGRDRLVDELAETVLDQADDLVDGGFLFHEFLENQGTRLHFLCLILGQLEQSAETCGEAEAAAPPPAVETQQPAAPAQSRKRRASPRPRARGGKKMPSQSSPEGSPDDA